MPESQPVAAPAPPIRTVVRGAVEGGWQAAIERGQLPPLDPADRPPVEIERPGNPEHGDLATSLALKLARPYRRAPIPIATVLPGDPGGARAPCGGARL